MGLPTGPAVTFLFTDIEGSTRLERSVGSMAWAGIVARHDRLLREAIEAHGGIVVKTEGDAFFAAFERPADAADAVVAAQRALAAETWPTEKPLRVRMGLHHGEGRLRDGRGPDDPEDYVGIDVNYAARIAAAGNGGQIVVSAVLARELAGWTSAGVRLVDEGLRAVKDFDEPAQLHRLEVQGAADDPRPLRTSEPPSNLPGEVTPLVGRDAEIASVREALVESRIVTLTGPGGSGKTRLALGVAAALTQRFPHGTWFVDLASLRDAALVESAIASTIGLGESSDVTIGEALRAHLRDRILLLVLDNLEQLLPAAADTVARLVRAAPSVTTLVTSRELLRIGGERGYPVPPLDIEAGVALFERLARLHRPDLHLGDDSRATVRAISERLGGLPLAIELAAARIRLMKPAQILQQLGHSLDLSSGARDAPERQRTLRAAITWSHDLLTADERRTFRALGVFSGGFTFEAVQVVIDADGTGDLDLFSGLESLTDKSLIRVEPGEEGRPDDAQRFGLHPLLREYALERLDEAGERTTIEAAHAHWIERITSEAGERILAPGGDAILHRLDHDQHNLRAALDWSLGPHGDVGLGLRVMGWTWRWFQQRAHLREGRSLARQLLDAPGAHDDARARIAGLTADGGIAYWMDDIVGSRASYSERLALAETTGDPMLIADANYDLGFTAMVMGDAATLLTHERRAFELYEQVGDADATLRARQALVLATFLTGDYERARELEVLDLAAFRERGSPFQIADSCTFLAAVYMRLGDGERSWAHLKEALAIFVGNDTASGIARGLGMAAIVQATVGDAELAARLAGTTYELVREKSVMLAPVKVLHLPEPADLVRERLGQERADALMAEGAATSVADAVAMVLAAPPPRRTVPDPIVAGS